MSMKFNPLIFSGFDLSGTGGGGGSAFWGAPVDTELDLPVSGLPGECRVVKDTDHIYVWDAVASLWADTGYGIETFGGTSAEGLSLSSAVDGSILRTNIGLNEASSTTPGAVSTGTQTFAGDKEFLGVINATGGINVNTIDTTETGPADTLNIGATNADTINIGHSGAIVNVQGTTFYQDVTNLEVTDKNITINKGGSAGSGGTAGLEVEENGSITGYAETSSNRNSWVLKAPNTAGIATITPGAAGITLDQSTSELLPLDGTRSMTGALNMNTHQINNLSAGTVSTDAVNLGQLQTVTTDIFAVTKEPTGYVNRTDSTMSFNDGTRQFTIQPTGVSFDFYIKGQKFTKTTAQVITLPNSPGDHYIYFDATGNLASTQVFTSEIITDYVFTSIIYWNTDTSSHTYFAEERHGLTMDGVTHSYLHTVFGARYLSGLALQNFTVGTGGSNADAQFDVDQGQIRDEDLLLVISAQAQIPILYRQGQQWRKKTADAFPVIYSGTAGYTGASGRLPYNQYTGGAWQLTEVQNNKYVLCHFFATNDRENGVVGIQGIAEYDSMEAARTAANTEITSLGGLPFAEFVPIGTVVFQTSNTMTNTPKADVIPIDGANYIDFRGTQLYTPAGSATTHGLLSGLANDDHFQYLLADGSRAMSGALDMGTHQINNVVDGVANDDAATVGQLNNATSGTIATFAGFDSTTGVLTSVTGWSFDDQGSAQIGAQNSLVIPPGTTDFTTLSISPTVSNTGINNLQAIQINPAINQPVQFMTLFQSYGYGTSAPVNFTSFSSNPGFTGSVTNLTHFSIDGAVDATTMIGYNYFPSGDSTSETAFQATSSGTTTNYTGVSISPSGTSTNFTAFSSSPNGNTANYTGLNISPQNSGTNFTGTTINGTATYTNVTALDIDLTSITSPNRKTALNVDGGYINQGFTFTTANNLVVDSGNVLRPIFEVSSGSTITGTDVILNNLSGFIDIKDDVLTTGPLNIGAVSVGFVSQLAVASGKTIPKVTMCLGAAAIEATSAGGTVTDLQLFDATAVNAGGTLTVTNLYGFRFETNTSAVATNTWGISIEDISAENYIAKSLVIGGSAPGVASNSDVALEINAPKTLVLGNATTIQRNAITNLAGSVIYDTDTTKPYYNDGTQWVEFGGGLQPGDIAQTSFNALDNQAVAQNITGLAFSNAVTRGFDVEVTIERGSTYANYSLKGIQKGSSWEMSQDYIGDDTGIAFSITTLGQLQYTSTNTGSNATLRFRAETV